MDGVYLGAVFLWAPSFAPRGYAFCAGQLLSIAQNDALFALIGTTFGGDGQTTFALPNLIGRTPLGVGQGPGLSNYALGQTGGSETVTLTGNNLAYHTHTVAAELQAAIPVATTDATEAQPADNVILGSGNFVQTNEQGPPTRPANLFVAVQNPEATLPVQMNGQVAVGSSGMNVPVQIMQPFAVLQYITPLYGIYPPQG
ncbi:tail fiber protein [Tistrella mobilis]|jgi:microcystin-dependent protein|uniref:phage tail protein n=1 Tax=Tistrella mobilis TaxID=171437 RepID=UPI0035576635